jgi:hypothetical protein
VPADGKTARKKLIEHSSAFTARFLLLSGGPQALAYYPPECQKTQVGFFCTKGTWDCPSNGISSEAAAVQDLFSENNLFYMQEL